MVELQHSLLLPQLAAVAEILITVQVVEEILPTVQAVLERLALPEVLQAHNQMLMEIQLLLEFLKAALAQLLTALFMEQVELVGLQIRVELAGSV
jgi:hypothetical protein